jgi:hypothetical protein
MQRCDITWAILQLKALGIDDVLHFDFLSPPPSDAIVYAVSVGGIVENAYLDHYSQFLVWSLVCL